VDNTINWDLVWAIERDIAGLYYWQSQKNGIDADLPYEKIYNLSYWDVFLIGLPEMPPEEESYIINGCLMFLICICIEFLDGSGFYLNKFKSEFSEVVLNPKTKKSHLSKTLNLLLICIEIKSSDYDCDDLISAKKFFMKTCQDSFNRLGPH
jgi:hypothetical protein